MKVKAIAPWFGSNRMLAECRPHAGGERPAQGGHQSGGSGSVPRVGTTTVPAALFVVGGRDRRVGDRSLGEASNVDRPPTDALVYQGRHRAFPGALIGMKPPAFAEWMFRLLGATAGDQLDDLYPGSGAIGEAWRRFTGTAATAMQRVNVQQPSAAARQATTKAMRREDPSDTRRQQLVVTGLSWCFH